MIVLAIVGLVLIGPFFVAYGPYDIAGVPNDPPSFTHLFGTDNFGHDLFSQITFGGASSLIVSLYSALGGTLLGFLAGLLAGYYGKLESPIAGATDVMMTFPGLPLLIVVALIFLGNPQAVPLTLILFMWAPAARAARAQTTSAKKLAYIDAAKCSGLSDFQIVFRIIMSEVAPIALAYFVLNLSLGIVLITALQFLGGGNPLIVSWGSILFWAQQSAFIYGDWWWIFAPGAIIALISIGFALIGFSVEELWNRRLRT
ncbi:MAG: ABC transporter permease [Thaumarchaeota archaeon]|nr:ABC transporter permease [Nitrososphaerota archaeon]